MIRRIVPVYYEAGMEKRDCCKMEKHFVTAPFLWQVTNLGYHISGGTPQDSVPRCIGHIRAWTGTAFYSLLKKRGNIIQAFLGFGVFLNQNRQNSRQNRHERGWRSHGIIINQTGGLT